MVEMTQADQLSAMCAADRELARALDMLHHIRSGGFYPPNSDSEARFEFSDYLRTIETARGGLAAAIDALRHDIALNESLSDDLEELRVHIRAFLVEGRLHTAPPPPPAPPPCRDHKGRPIFRSEESRG